MKAEYIQNQNKDINDSNKPTNANSETKISMKNIDNNINYSDSEEENNISNENKNNGNSNQDENELNKEEKKESNNSPQNNVRNNNENDNENDNENENDNDKVNENDNDDNDNDNESESNSNNNDNINDNNFNKQLNNNIIQQRPTYTGYLSDNKLTGYSNFFINHDKRALSGEKNYRPNNAFYSPNINKNDTINILGNNNSKYILNNNNQILRSNFAPTSPNPTAIQIKRTPQDEINTNNYKRNLNQDFYQLRNNNYRPVGNYNDNVNSNLNQTSPNLSLGHYITNVKKLTNKKIDNDEYNFNNRVNSNDIQTLPINYRNQLNKETELPGGNKTMGYLPIRKPYSSSNLDIQNYQRNANINPQRLPNQNQVPINPYINNNNNLSLTMNYVNRNNQINQMKNQPLNFEQALKQNQLNNLNNNSNNGRITIVKKLPPMNDSDPKDNIRPINRYLSGQALNNQKSPGLGINNSRNNLLGNNNVNVKKLDNNGNPIQNEGNISKGIQNVNNPNNNITQNAAYNPRINLQQNQQIFNQQNNQKQILDAANTNRNYLPQNQASNTLINQNRPPQANQINQQNNNQNQLLAQEKNVNSIRDTVSQNSEDNKNITGESPVKKNIDISYNDFDGSGWVKNYGGVSRPGKDVMGNQKINQDALVSITNINNIKDFNIFGILDGHGPQGHYVSELASEYIPLEIINNPEIKALKEPEEIYEKLKENNCQIITNAFLSCDEELKKVDFDVLSSGSTCVIIIHIGTHIICANVGDSRGIIVYNDDDENNDPELNDLEVAQLSMDYKPELLDEKNRILLNGGVVEKMKNEFGEEVGPFRVWAKGTDYPGLAMSRSIGDFKGKRVGVIAEPGIMEYDLCEASKYIVICSDGVWEFINNEEVKNMGKTFYLNNDPSGFCHHIINNSVLRWEKNEIIIDDISIVTVFF